MKSNKAKDFPAQFANSSLRFFETNDKKPKPNAKSEIMQKINDLSEKFSGRTGYNMNEYQSKPSESENWTKNWAKTSYARENQKNEEIQIKSQSAQIQTPIPNKDNKQERELQRELEDLAAELAKQKHILEEKRRVHDEKVFNLNFQKNWNFQIIFFFLIKIKFKAKQTENAIEEQRKKNDDLSEEIDQINVFFLDFLKIIFFFLIKKAEYESQISILKTSLQELRSQYELKLKEFEKMLKSSAETIKNLQTTIKESNKSK